MGDNSSEQPRPTGKKIGLRIDPEEAMNILAEKLKKDPKKVTVVDAYNYINDEVDKELKKKKHK